jgi:hypothetical protein
MTPSSAATRCRGVALLALLAKIALSTAPSVAATASEPPPDVLAFDRFVTVSDPVCQHQPAGDCVDLGFAFADADGDGRLSVAELEALHHQIQAWSEWRRPELSTFEARSIGLGLWVVNTLGVPALLSLYDEDQDDHLTRAELLADMRLDERPLGEVLLDPDAVDRQSIARRLGALAPLLDQALP